MSKVSYKEMLGSKNLDSFVLQPVVETSSVSQEEEKPVAN